MPASVTTLDFVEKCQQAGAADEIRDLLFAETARLGIAFVACASHVDPLNPPEGAVSMVNYPLVWLERFSAENYALRDPIFMGAQHAATPFHWDAFTKGQKLWRDQRKILHEAAECGVAGGMTIPIHSPGALPASCSLVPGPDGVDPLIVPELNFISIYAHEEARLRVGGKRRAPTALTKRQKECLALAGSAKSDWVIGTLLGISAATVHNTIEHAKRRYGVSHRIQAVTRAVLEGQIQIDDLAD